MSLSCLQSDERIETEVFAMCLADPIHRWFNSLDKLLPDHRFFVLFPVLIGGVTGAACSIMEAPNSEPAAPGTEPIEVPYYTPAQQEGPYYPVNKPADLDNDLVDYAGAADAPAGEVLVLAGVVYDTNGLPVEGAVIEIWQADSKGIYMHPDDPDTGMRDTNFQFYGQALTGVDGVYSFRTVLPGIYGLRPRHIHSKVKLDGETLLTTQFFFGNEVSFAGAEANLVIELAPAEDDLGNPIWVGERDIILNIDR